MTDLNQILAGNVDEVTGALAALTADQLTELKALEEADKNRKGVLTAIAAALAAVAANGASASEGIEPTPIADDTAATVDDGAASTSVDTVEPAPIAEGAPATEADDTVIVLSDLLEMSEPPAPEPANEPFVEPLAVAPAIEPEAVQSDAEPLGDDLPAYEPVTAEAPPAAGSAIDMSHFAVDTNLRAGTTVEQNRIDFNDPRIDGREVVEAALAAQVEG